MDSIIHKLLQAFKRSTDDPKGHKVINSLFAQIHHVDNKTFKLFCEHYSPVFFLNTGRSGSAFLENVFRNIKEIRPYHEASPNLMMFSNFTFHNQGESTMLRKIFEASRVELILDAFVNDKVFVETNHCLTFFAHQIRAVFPKARFVHLLRHPGDFIRSAIMKGWHRNDTIWENNRIRMMDDSPWSLLSQLERLAWVWNTTHTFIEEFKNSCPGNILTVKFEDLISKKEGLIELIKFLNHDSYLDDQLLTRLQSEKINEILIHKSEPANMFKLAEYPRYLDWVSSQKEMVRKFTGKLAEKYSYQL